MKKILFMTMLFSLGHTTFAQNKLDSLAPQKWLIYLDNNLNIVTDTSMPVYSRYTFFIKGKDIYPQMKHYIGKNFQLKITNNESSSGTKLNGTYSWYDSKGKLSSEHVYKNGEYISIKEFDKKGRLRQKFDFTVQSNNDPISFCVYQFNKKSNKIKTHFFQKDKNGNWPKMR